MCLLETVRTEKLNNVLTELADNCEQIEPLKGYQASEKKDMGSVNWRKNSIGQSIAIVECQMKVQAIKVLIS